MIIVKLTGGLGNQMFQYAAARAVSWKSRCELALDIREYRRSGDRHFGLEPFQIEARVCESDVCLGVRLPPARNQILSYLYWCFTTGRSLTYYREKSLTFEPPVLQLKGPAYLHGYFQSEKYFLEAQQILRHEFTVKTPPAGENRKWIDHMAHTESVSVHVRRGDYVTDPKASQVHGTCSPAYYCKSAELLQEKLRKPVVFYILSDDPAWARENIRLPGETHVLCHNDDEHNYEDLRLMSSCKHHIVANSSFSWWGAWLGSNPGRTVIAPRTWFRDPGKSDSDLVPDSWIRV